MPMYYKSILLLLLLIVKTDSYIPSFFQDAINIYQQHQSILLPTNIDISYAPPALPLSPLLQPSFEDLRNYAISVSEILKQDVDSATKIITNDAVLVAEEIRDAALPDSGDQLFGVVIGEATAGFISGIASRFVAKILKDEKRDGEISKGISTSAFFGTRGFIRGVAQLAGIPRPIARILASIGATAFSESAKVAARANEAAKETLDVDYESYELTSNIKKDDDNKKSILSQKLSNKDSMKLSNKKVYGSPIKTKDIITPTNEDIEKKPLISPSEITGDVTKWVLYDLLLPLRSTENSPLLEMIGASAQVGAVAGFGGKIISVLVEKAEKNNTNTKKKDKKLTTQLIFAVIEGATLFAAYEGSVSLLDVDILPTAPEFLQTIIEYQWF